MRWCQHRLYDQVIKLQKSCTVEVACAPGAIRQQSAHKYIERWWSAQGLACRKEEGRRPVGNLSSLASYYYISIYL